MTRCFFAGLIDAYAQLLIGETSWLADTPHDSTVTENTSRVTSGWNHTEEHFAVSLKESIVDLSAEYRTTHPSISISLNDNDSQRTSINDNRSARESKAFLTRLPRSVAPSSDDDKPQPRPVTQAWPKTATRKSEPPSRGASSSEWLRSISPNNSPGKDHIPRNLNSAAVTLDKVIAHPVIGDSLIRYPVTHDSVARGTVFHDLANRGSVLRHSSFRRRAGEDVGFSTDAEPHRVPEWDSFQRRRPAPVQGSTFRRRVHRLVSQVSRAVTWLPRMMSRRMHRLGRWMSSRVLRSDTNQGVPASQHFQKGQDDYQKNQRGYQVHQTDYSEDQHDKQSQLNEQHGHQKVRRGQQLTSAGLQHTPADLKRRLECACNTLSRRRLRSVGFHNALGTFLSTSFWIPALGLFYLIGLSR